MAYQQQQSPLPQPSQDEQEDAKKRILWLQEESRNVKCAASAELWVAQGDKDPVNYVGTSSPDLTICAEQACIKQVGGIFPPLQASQYSRLFLYHIKGISPCQRCESQFLQLSDHKHPIRIWWGF